MFSSRAVTATVIIIVKTSSSWQTLVRALPYWWLVARCPYL